MISTLPFIFKYRKAVFTEHFVAAPARSPLGAGTPRTAFCYRPRYRPPAAEAHDMGLPRPPLVSATS